MIDTNIVYYDDRINKLFTVKEEKGNKIIVGGMTEFFESARTVISRYSMSREYLEKCIPIDETSDVLIPHVFSDNWTAYKLKSELPHFYGDDEVKYMHMKSIHLMDKNRGCGDRCEVHVIYSADWCHCFWNLFAKGSRRWGFNYWFSKPIMPYEHSSEHFTLYFGYGEICFEIYGSKPAYFPDRKGCNFFRWIWACTDICRKITVGGKE